MHEIKLLELVHRRLFSHGKVSVFKAEDNSAGLTQKYVSVVPRSAISFQCGPFCVPCRCGGYCDQCRSKVFTQKRNFSVGQIRNLKFLQLGTTYDPRKGTGFKQKRNFSVGERRDLKFIQFSTYCDPCGVRLGCVKNDCVVDLNAEDSCIPSNMLDLLRCGAINNVRSLMTIQNLPGVPLREVAIRAPIYGMDKIIGVGVNYWDHCKEKNMSNPKEPVFFSKFSSTVLGPCEPLRIKHHLTQKVDWEVELCIVIGKTACDVPEECAYNYIAGCTVGQDISARDWQATRNGGQFLLGKSMDTFFPIGPYIVTLDEVGNINNLGIGCSVNGCIQQCGTTRDLIYKIPTLISRLSSVMTLYPGDIIMTGTPAGVGANKKPQQFLYPGDVLYSWVDNVCSMYTFVQKFDPCKEPEQYCKPCTRN